MRVCLGKSGQAGASVKGPGSGKYRRGPGLTKGGFGVRHESAAAPMREA